MKSICFLARATMFSFHFLDLTVTFERSEYLLGKKKIVNYRVSHLGINGFFDFLPNPFFSLCLKWSNLV